MTEAEIRERMNRIGNNVAKVIAYGDVSQIQRTEKVEAIADGIAVLTQFFIDIHKIAASSPRPSSYSVDRNP